MSSTSKFKFVVGPDGKMKTVTDYDAVTPEQLESLRKEVKDMIAGNKKFHEDPYTPPEQIEFDFEVENYMYGTDLEHYLVPYQSNKGWKLAHYAFENDEYVLKGTFSKIFNTFEEANEAASTFRSSP